MTNVNGLESLHYPIEQHITKSNLLRATAETILHTSKEIPEICADRSAGMNLTHERTACRRQQTRISLSVFRPDQPRQPLHSSDKESHVMKSIHLQLDKVTFVILLAATETPFLVGDALQ
jgi:hypothetical protein